MRVATWNVNSLKVRMPRVAEWIGYARPDVLLLQETKMTDEAFPAKDLKKLGYETAHHGQGQWNGVAILSKVGLEDVVNGFADRGEPDTDARLITATCGGVQVSSAYVPNGREVGHDHYHYKLDWMGRLKAHMAATTSKGKLALVGGDFNICPDDKDVWDPHNPVPRTHVTDAERNALKTLCGWGLVDLFRQRYEEGEGLFSWWDYRDGKFYKRQGLRIDLLLATEPLAKKLQFCLIDRNARKGTKPSDHAPVFADLAV